MKFNFLFLIAFCFMVITSRAQEAGHSMVGVQTGFNVVNASSGDESKTRFSTFDIGLSYGIFYNENFALGLNVGYSYQMNGYFYDNYYGSEYLYFAPFWRNQKYLNEKVSVFFDVSVGLNINLTEERGISNNSNVLFSNFGGGFAYRIKERLALEAKLFELEYYRYKVDFRDYPDQSNTVNGLALDYFLSSPQLIMRFYF